MAAETKSDLASAVREALAPSPDSCIENSAAFAASLPGGGACDHDVLVGAIKSLEVDGVVVSEMKQTQTWVLTKEGQVIAVTGSPEFQVYQATPADGSEVSKAQLEESLGKDLVKIGLGPCMKQKWLSKGAGGGMARSVGANSVSDAVQTALQRIEKSGQVTEEESKDLKRRKLVALQTQKYFVVRRGPDYALEAVTRVADLSWDMLTSDAWKTAKFKDYNFCSLGVPTSGGYLHPLLKVRAEFRQILMQMGFEEMPTNRWVESSFWNFDSLFQPQSHPARDAHDTFFIKEPENALSVPEDYVQVVQKTHESGGFGSIGYQCDWKRSEAMKNLLRTHTTAISSQMLYRLARDMDGGKPFTPKRYFSIDRVFRNESMDATHLCEFHQVEGLVADRNLCLGDLIGTIKTFFEKIGITNVRFKPAYNPYTEPSMEIFGYHPDLKRWTEIGNSGMFRPEMLRPMGLPEDVRVIAWGLSLERPTMIKYRISNIRELFGHKVNIEGTKRAPVCRFDV